jgi:hypothetical protein
VVLRRRRALRWGRRRRRRSLRGRSLWGSSTIVRTAGRRRRICISGWRRRAIPWGARVKRRDVEGAELSPLVVVLYTLRRIAQNLVCSLYLLELDNKLGLAPWIAVRVVLESQLPKSLPYLILVCVGSDPEVLVVVPTGIHLGHGDGDGYEAAVKRAFALKGEACSL